ncbi:hypothetical protein [Streptomyces sp. HO565]|uniref:hypothetical protein n=1 Tax=Streptomyces sp. HO565 TaxID=2857489 RepID=UPI0034DCAF27
MQSLLDVGHPTVPEADEMMDDQSRSGQLVVDHRVVEGGVPMAADDHGGYEAPQAFEVGAAGRQGAAMVHPRH